jgi:hypothetical protein
LVGWYGGRDIGVCTQVHEEDYRAQVCAHALKQGADATLALPHSIAIGSPLSLFGLPKKQKQFVLKRNVVRVFGSDVDAARADGAQRDRELRTRWVFGRRRPVQRKCGEFLVSCS